MGVYSKAKIKLRGATENYMAVQLVGKRRRAAEWTHGAQGKQL